MRVEPYTPSVVAPYATQGFVTIRATVDAGGKSISFLCPACKFRHTHGIGGGIGGHRLSHCRLRPDPFGGSYWLEVATDDECDPE